MARATRQPPGFQLPALRKMTPFGLTARIAACVSQDKAAFAVVEVQDPLRFITQPAEEEDKPITPGFWTILEDRYQGVLDQTAEQIVQRGP